MDAARHLEIVRDQGDRLAALPAEALGAQVPSLEDWTVERVVRHVGKVHRWVTGALGLGADGDMGSLPPTDSLPKGADCLPAYRESLDHMLDEFARRDPSDPVPSFGGPADVAWWARRQAHELAVHRTDAEDAVHAEGGAAPAPVDREGAADGIDEWARFFLATRWAQRFGPLPDDLHGRTVHIHGTDDPAPAGGAEWLLTFGTDGVEVAATHAKGDVALRGPAADLLLVLWRRRPLGTLDVIGDTSLAARILDLARF